MSPLRLAILCDLKEENWPSMDLFGEMLARTLRAHHRDAVDAVSICPPLARRFSRLPFFPGRLTHNLDRLLNRTWHYPRLARRQSFDFYHVVDHSYAQLVHALPADRTGVFCHDLDTFRCLLEPGRERRPRWFRAMARHILCGMQKAAVVFHTTEQVREEIVRYGLLDPARLVQAPPGPAPDFTPDSGEPEPPVEALHSLSGAPFCLHVGSCIPRKRIDVLLNVFAAVRAGHPHLRLVQVGGQWTAAQQQQIAQLGIADAVVQVRGLERRAIASLYRTAAMVLLPTEAEGFGLPIIEALACGAAVIASDIPVLREVGGDAVVFAPVGDVPAWAAAVSRLLTSPATAPSRSLRLRQAARYSWEEHVRTILEAYQRLSGVVPQLRTQPV